MRADVRHQMKQDPIRNATVHWTVEHKDSILRYGGIAIVLVVVAIAAWAYMNHREELASVELNRAVRTYTEPVRPAGTPDTPEFPSFASAADRAKKAHEMFEAVASKYSSTHSGDMARYFAGITAGEMNDTATAERELKQIADGSNHNLAALGQMALAALYRNSGRDAQAIELYKKLTERPASTVSKQTAQIELASVYISKQQPLEARKIYEQLQKDNPNTDFAKLAAEKLAELNKP